MLLDGKKIRDELLAKAKIKIAKKNIRATLAIILIGEDEISKIYIRNKEKYCQYVGINVKKYFLDANVKENAVIDLIKKLNKDSNITGIILQSPTPKHINFNYVTNFIASNKDIDGFTTENIYNLYQNTPKFIPCTVKGILKLLEYYNISLTGKDVLIIGRGSIVGRPLYLALLNKDATVTIAHSKTKDLKAKTKNADIIISAVGKENLITKDMINKNSVIIDVGISRKDGKIKGDVDFANVMPICQSITPNPGGIGPLTIAMLIDNIIYAYERKE